MEYLEGETLADRLVKALLPIDEVVKIGGQVAEALDKAHRQGIVHRDLKPANIMLTKSGAKLMDFGLAKPAATVMAAMATGGSPLTPSSPTTPLVSLTKVASPLTQEGMIVGTYQFMAPEVLQGAEADARSDIFSLGCVLYEMATGKRAFEAKSQISVLAAILASSTLSRPARVTRQPHMLFLNAIAGGWLLMMGHQTRSESLFYYFRLEDQIPEAHPLTITEFAMAASKYEL